MARTPRQPAVVGLIKRTFKSRFALARLTRRAFFGRIIRRFLFKGDEIFYLPRLPRDGTILIDQDVGPAPDSMPVPSRLIDHFIDRAEVLVVLDKCICRDASHCKDYPVDLGCLFLGKAAARISPALGRRVTKDEARDHVRRGQEAGLVHLVGKNKLDTVWLNVAPGEKLLTICSCCPCCCLWRMLPDLAPAISGKITRLPGVSVAVTDRCQGCGTCADGRCFVNAIHLQDGRASIDQGTCRGCGRCAEACPSKAIEVRISDGLFIDKTIEAIERIVDVT